MRRALARLVTFALVSVAALGAHAQHPLGLPRLGKAEPPPHVTALGRALFFSPRLSADGRMSCANCHRPEQAFTDGLATAKGLRGATGTRNTPSLLNARFMETLFWDGRRASLEEAVLDPLFNKVEHGLGDDKALRRAIGGDAALSALHRSAYGRSADHGTRADVGQALAAYVGSLQSGDSPFDRYHFGGQASAMTPEAIRGLALFRGRAGCAACHTIGAKNALFTDHGFHALGLLGDAANRNLPALVARARALQPARLGDTLLTDADIAALGRYNVTRRPSDIGKFRTPSLRNVALTAPYMHDGSVATLEEAVEMEIAYRGLAGGRPVSLSTEERLQLVEFLQALTSTSTHEPFTPAAHVVQTLPRKLQAPRLSVMNAIRIRSAVAHE